jgi:hypothetical protein
LSFPGHSDVLTGSGFKKAGPVLKPKVVMARFMRAIHVFAARNRRKERPRLSPGQAWMTRQKSLKEGRVMTVKFGFEN